MNSILAATDGTETISYISLMLSSNNDCLFIIVEGDDDIDFFRKFSLQHVDIQKAKKGGWSQVYEVVSHFSNDRVIGIRDADFASLLSENLPDRIFCSDYHDIELMMLSSSAWNRLCDEYYHADTCTLNELKEKLLLALEQVSLTKFINYIENIKLCFRAVNIINHFNSTDISISLTSYVEELNNKSSNKVRSISSDEVLSFDAISIKIENEKYFPHFALLYKRWKIVFLHHLINGHDFIKCFASHVTETRRRHGGVGADVIGRSLRTAYTREDFRKTKLWKGIRKYSNDKNLLFF